MMSITGRPKSITIQINNIKQYQGIVLIYFDKFSILNSFHMITEKIRK